MLNRRFDRLTVLDMLLVVLLLALPGMALVRSWTARNEKPVAFVYHDNRLVGVYQLDREQTLLIGDKVRPDMKIEIRNGAVRVAESDCPRGICMQAGWVRTPGRSIVCVPNKVLIEVGRSGPCPTVRGEHQGYDAESY